MRSWMSLLAIGCLCAAGAAATADDKPFFGLKHQGDRIAQADVSLGRKSLSTSDYAYQNVPPPAPAAEGSTVPPAPMPEGAVPEVGKDPVPLSSAPIELFPCVKYKEKDEMHPCAVPMIVSIKDPCASDDPCSCCDTKCVHVKVCAPPCGCPEIRCSKDGSRVKYDYGKYGFTVVSRKGTVTVEYDD